MPPLVSTLAQSMPPSSAVVSPPVCVVEPSKLETITPPPPPPDCFCDPCLPVSVSTTPATSSSPANENRAIFQGFSWYFCFGPDDVVLAGAASLSSIETPFPWKPLTEVGAAPGHENARGHEGQGAVGRRRDRARETSLRGCVLANGPYPRHAVEPPSISLCVITLNEERAIERCLRSAPFARDLVVLDSGSTDRTVEIARSLGARVFVEPFRGHVLQKARAVELAANDWVLCLDADESLSPELAQAIPPALARDGAAVAGFEVARHTFYLGRYIDHGGWWPEWRLRLFDRRLGGWTGVDPHDRVEVKGS